MAIRIVVIGLFSALLLSSGNYAHAQESSTYQIDGVWEHHGWSGTMPSLTNFEISDGTITASGSNALVRLLGSAVIIIDLKRVNRNTYFGLLAKDQRVKVKLVVNGRTIMMTVDPDKTGGHGVYRQDLLSNPILVNRNSLSTPFNTTIDHNVTISYSDPIRVLSETQYQKISPGVQMSVNKSHVIRQNISYSNDIGFVNNKSLEYSLSSFGFGTKLNQGIQNRVENSVSGSVEQETLNSVTLNLNGDIGTRWKVSWYDIVQNGKVSFTDLKGTRRFIFFKKVISSEVEVENATKK